MLKYQIFQQRKNFLLICILLCELALVICHITFTWPAKGTFSSFTVRCFHLDREFNLPSFFSSAQFFLLAAVLVHIRRFKIMRGDADARAHMWRGLALGAGFLGLDEAFQIHENLGSLLGWIAESAPSGSLLSAVLNFPSYYWAIIYTPIALPAALFIVAFLWRELGPQRWYPLLGIALFLLGAVGLDFIEGGLGNSNHTPFPVEILGTRRIFDSFLFEELFEMLGVTLVLAGCLSLLVRVASFGHQAPAEP